MPVTVKKGGGRKPVASTDNVTPPSEQIIATAVGNSTITTRSGMVIGIRKLTAFNEMQLTRAVGRDSGNEQYMLWCTMAAAVASIDGDKLPMPSTALECEAVIQRIGNDGVSGLQAYVLRQMNELNRAGPKEELREAVGK